MPAGFDWAPLSSIPIDTVDSSGSAVALDTIVPPARADGIDRTADLNRPPSNARASRGAAAPIRSQGSVTLRRGLLAAGLVLAAVGAGTTLNPDAIRRSFRQLALTADRELVALFTPVATRIVPGASAGSPTRPSPQDVMLAAPTPTAPAVVTRKTSPEAAPPSSSAQTRADRPVVMGRLNVNAVPWAEVWVDGRPIGQTPIGNIPISAGSHRLTFRHPDFGELETVAIVTANETAYATMHFTTSN